MVLISGHHSTALTPTRAIQDPSSQGAWLVAEEVWRQGICETTISQVVLQLQGCVDVWTVQISSL